MIDLKQEYGKRYRVSPEGEILGKRGYIRPFRDGLELYLSNRRVALRLERSSPHFRPYSHYDDATAFLFSSEHIDEACKAVVARRRRRLTPQALEQLTRMRLLRGQGL